MSFTQNYGVRDPTIEDSEETIFTNEETIQCEIEDHLAEEEANLEKIRRIDREMRL